jgi:hypothetical protein
MNPDPGLTFKFVSQTVYDQGYTVKHNDLAVYEAALVASPGYPFPEPPPLPPPVCTPPFSACSFGSPSNTAAELANIAAWLAVADSFFAVDPADPTTVATFLGGWLEPVSITRRSGALTAQPSGYMEISSALEYLNTVLADVGCTISASGFFGLGIDEVVATGDTIFVKYRVIGGPIPEYPNGYDSYSFSVIHMDPAGSGLIVGTDEWFDGIQGEAYADACTPAAPLTGRRLGEGNAYKGPALKTLLGTAHKGSGPA